MVFREWVIGVVGTHTTYRSNSAKVLYRHTARIPESLLTIQGTTFSHARVHSGLCRCGRLYFNRMIICVLYASMLWVKQYHYLGLEGVPGFSVLSVSFK